MKKFSKFGKKKKRNQTRAPVAQRREHRPSKPGIEVRFLSGAMHFFTPLSKLKIISPVFLEKLRKLKIKTVKNLLYHFPLRYEQFSNFLKVSQVKVGERVCLEGKILDIQNVESPKKKMVLTQAVFSDETGAIEVVWFNQPFLTSVLKKGDRVILAGKVSFGERGIFISNPIYEKIEKEKAILHTKGLVPIYPETEGITSRWLRWAINFFLKKLSQKIPEILPKEILEKENLPELEKALWQIHFPQKKEDFEKARERFAFEEIFLLELKVLRERLKIKQQKAYSIPINLELIKKFTFSLPFELTLAQKKAIWQILKDMEQERPMNRLLQGDVGSGKTICAMAASLNTAKTGYQVALMAPTEILAQQHFQSFLEFLKNFGLKIGLLTRGERKILKERLSKPEILKATREGKIDILIGTHALIQEKISFRKLALVILDEQHRFGVEQRAKLAKKESQGIFFPHFLSMTATPIPRTLALTIYGDLDFSVLDQMPFKRKVITKVFSEKEKEEVFEFISNKIKSGKQAFFICPRIEKKEGQSAQKEIKAVKEEFEKIKKAFPQFKVEMLHGKMKTREKERIMKDFKDGKIQILVSTSVVEVGIDVPNAQIMVIEGAERFGLAQLHQMRGRVGRRQETGYCFLFLEAPSKKAKERLEALTKIDNGLELAKIDLEMRGPGEILGKKQWGFSELALKYFSNLPLIEKAREAAKEILEKDFELKNYPALKRSLKSFEKIIHLE